MVARRRRVLRGYTDITVLRPGSLWTLYRAFDVETSEWVAMKVIPAGAVEEYLLDELAAEIDNLQPANAHPNVATTYRYLRRRDGSAAVVTELCRESWADRLDRDGTVPVTQAVRASRQAAAALSAVHSLGLMHRDVRPSRLLVSRSGATVVDGFGLSILRMATRTPNASVSPHAAPELFEGRSASPATDVYGLASTLFELISGHPAFETFDGDEPASLILRIIGRPAPALRAPGVPVALTDLILQAMAKDPQDRPASPEEFSAELSAIERAVIQAEQDRFERTDKAVAASNDATVAPAEPGTITRPTSVFEDAGSALLGVEGARERSRSVRNVLTPLTAGRGAPPVRVERIRADEARVGQTRVDRPQAGESEATRPEFAEPESAAPAVPQRPTGAVATTPAMSGTVAGDVPALPQDRTGHEQSWTRQHTLAVAAWLVVGLATAVVTVALLLIAGAI